MLQYTTLLFLMITCSIMKLGGGGGYVSNDIDTAAGCWTLGIAGKKFFGIPVRSYSPRCKPFSPITINDPVFYFNPSQLRPLKSPAWFLLFIPVLPVLLLRRERSRLTQFFLHKHASVHYEVLQPGIRIRIASKFQHSAY